MEMLLEFAWPPGHPILVNFTAALIPASFLADLLGRVLRKDSLGHAGFWMLILGALITPVTVYTGWDWKGDLFGGPMRTLPQELPAHQLLGTSLAVALLLLALWRIGLYRRQALASGSYLLAGLLAVGALVVQGYLGGRMTFG